VALVDERYTTATALRAIHEMGGRRRGREGDVDALAATVLLQQALRMQVLPALDPDAPATGDEETRDENA
jgi:RNase H-fold protein (predicted Holliday junction resolvase)